MRIAPPPFRAIFRYPSRYGVHDYSNPQRLDSDPGCSAQGTEGGCGDRRREDRFGRSVLRWDRGPRDRCRGRHRDARDGQHPHAHRHVRDEGRGGRSPVPGFPRQDVQNRFRPHRSGPRHRDPPGVHGDDAWRNDHLHGSLLLGGRHRQGHHGFRHPRGVVLVRPRRRQDHPEGQSSDQLQALHRYPQGQEEDRSRSRAAGGLRVQRGHLRRRQGPVG